MITYDACRHKSRVQEYLRLLRVTDVLAIV